MRLRIAIGAGGAATVAAIGAWTVLASRLFVWMGGLSAYFPSPWWTWWSYARQQRIDGTTLLYLIASGIIAAVPVLLLAAAVIAVCLRRRRRRLVPPPGGGLRPIEGGVTDNHGHAAFATQQQLGTRFAGPGCLMGAMDRSPRARLLSDNLDVGPGHSMSIAGPGSHKTGMAVHRLYRYRGPRVCFDPSREIGPIMTDTLTADGFSVHTIGIGSQGINALDWIDLKHPEADAHIRTAVDWIYDEGAGAAASSGRGGGDSQFFAKWGRSLAVCLAAHMLHFPSAEPEAKTLAMLRKGIATPENEMQALLKGIAATSASSMARDIAGTLMGMQAEETFSGIYANAAGATEWLSVGAYAAVVSGGPDAMPTSAILNSNTVVFVQIPLRSLLVTPAVGRAIMGALFNAMFHADGDVGDRILFEIDEAWVLGAMKEIELCYTTARKYRGAIHQILQSDYQLDKIWGRDGAKVLRNMCSWRSFNAIQDGDEANRLSLDMGEYGVMAYSEGDNQGRSKPWGLALGSRSKGSNVNVHEIKRPLIKRDEIMRSPADRMFILARDFPYPIDAVTAPYWRYPDIARRMNANRFFNPAAAE